MDVFVLDVPVQFVGTESRRLFFRMYFGKLTYHRRRWWAFIQCAQFSSGWRCTSIDVFPFDSAADDCSAQCFLCVSLQLHAPLSPKTVTHDSGRQALSLVYISIYRRTRRYRNCIRFSFGFLRVCLPHRSFFVLDSSLLLQLYEHMHHTT